MLFNRAQHKRLQQTAQAIADGKRKKGELAVRSVGLAQYMDQISDHEILTREEQVELARQMRAGGGEAEAARNRLIESHLRLVVKLANRYVGRGLPLEDLVGEGNLGLFDAARKFDPDRGFKFSTYAVNWIEQKLQRAINRARPFRFSQQAAERNVLARTAEDELMQELERMPTRHEVAGRAGLPIEQLEAIPPGDRRFISFDMTLLADEADGATVLDTLGDTNAPDPEGQAVDGDIAARLAAYVDQMPPRQAEVIRIRYGLDGTGFKSLEETGRILGISKQAVDTREQRALAYLRRKIGGQGVEAWL